jgi:hypothetical protein
MNPTTRDEFTDVIARNLGAPVVDINVDSDQVDDRVDEALKYYQKYHYNAVERYMYRKQITEGDMQNQYMLLDKTILSVSTIVFLGEGDNLSAHWMTNLGQSYRNMKWDISFGGGGSPETGGGRAGCSGGFGSITEYEMMLMHLKRIDNVFGNNKKQWEFNARTHKLQIYIGWNETFKVGDWIVFDTQQVVDPEKWEDLWSDEWLIEYATALVGRQWGANLSKFSGVDLPGGVQLDGDKIYDRYHERYMELREEMQLKFEMPVDFLVG